LYQCVHVVGMGNSSRKVDDADKRYTSMPKETERLCEVTNLPRWCD